MNYMQKFIETLAQTYDVSDPAAVKFIRAKILESFRNGQKVCPRCNPRKKLTGSEQQMVG